MQKLDYSMYPRVNALIDAYIPQADWDYAQSAQVDPVPYILVDWETLTVQQIFGDGHTVIMTIPDGFRTAIDEDDRARFILAGWEPDELGAWGLPSGLVAPASEPSL